MTGNTTEPVWAIATLFPNQGEWSEQEYLALETNRRIEFDDGTVEVQPVPTDQHQAIILFFLLTLKALTVEQGGTVRPAGLRLRLLERKYREPDVVFLRAVNDHRRHRTHWDGADLVVEVVSGDAKDRERDLVTKRAEYAQAGIPEYWIVDPQEEQVTVLRIEGETYVEHGSFKRGETASSALLPGLSVSVDDALDAD